MTNKTIIALALAAASFGLTSCGGGEADSKQKPAPTFDFERADSLDVTYLRELGTIHLSIEETAKMNQAMMAAGMSFNSGALLGAGRASGFAGTKGQAVGLGALGADMNYVLSYQQQAEAQKYLESIYRLAEGLGIRAAFDEDIMTQILEADSSTNTSILLTRAYQAAEDQLYSDDRAKLATFMVVGGWVEGMWIAADAMKAKKGDKAVWQGVFSHAYTYTNVMKMLEVFADKQGDADAKSLQTELRKAKGAVDKVLETKGQSMPDPTIEKLHSEISAVRKAVCG